MYISKHSGMDHTVLPGLTNGIAVIQPHKKLNQWPSRLNGNCQTIRKLAVKSVHVCVCVQIQKQYKKDELDDILQN